ncbi:hypothetical protein QUF73_13755 [Cytobacillus sp. NJ13]|nr:hypothetical protein [Cytobacillus sp. NJ13]
MGNWLELSEAQNEKVWTKICGELKFITYDISIYFGESEDLDAYDDLEEKALEFGV